MSKGMEMFRSQALRVDFGVASKLALRGPARIPEVSMPDKVTPTELTETEMAADLVSRSGAGNARAEAELAARYSDGLKYFRTSRSGDVALAEDLTQDTLGIALVKLRDQSIGEPEKLSGYLHGIANRLLMAHRKKTARRATDLDTPGIEETVADDDASQYGAFSSEETGRIVRQLLDQLPVARDKEILFRLYVDQHDREEICADLELTSAHFNRVLFRAKQRFRKLLEDAERRRGLRLIDGI